MALNRRELIAFLLGIPVALSGCANDGQLPPEGELLSQSFGIGHRLRDGYRPRPDVNAWKDVSVVIVGGGAAGLSAAWRLHEAGFNDFVVLELESAVGGTSRSGVSDLTPYPWGAHYVPVPFAENRQLIHLLTQMGIVESTDPDGAPIVHEQFLCREPEERLYMEGDWIEGLYPATDASSEDLAELAAFRKEIDRWCEWRDAEGRRAFVIPTRNASLDPRPLELDRISMSDWLRMQGWATSRLKWLVDYSCRDDYGLSSERTSAWAGLLYFASRQKKAGEEHQPLMTWPEGNGRMIEHFRRLVGDKVRTGAAVTQISPTSNSKSHSLEVTWGSVNEEEVAGFRAKKVIFAAPQFLAPHLIENYTRRTGRNGRAFEYGSWLVANLHLKARPKESSYPLCWDNVIHNSRSLGYVVATHQSGTDHGPTVLTWYYPYCDDDVREVRESLFRAQWSDLAQLVLTDLERPHPEIRSLTTRLDIFRWGHAMIRPKVGFFSSAERIQAQTPDSGIHFANTDLSGIALFEEAFDHGCRAAEEVLRSLGR